MSGFAFDDLPGALLGSPVSAGERIDPFYGSVWPDGSQATWSGYARFKRAEAAGFRKIPKYLKADPEAAWARLDSPAVLQRRLDVLGVVDSWRTATAEQVAAILGAPELASGVSHCVSDLFAMGLLEVGLVQDGAVRGARANRGLLYRPAHAGAATARLESLLTFPEWVSVTGGRGFGTLHQFDRHNLLSTELGLRIAEFLPVAGVVGEKHSSVNLLAYESLGQTSPNPTSQQCADMTAIRGDGLKIAVEVTASEGAVLERKIHHWAKVLSHRNLTDAGLVVVFVVAGRPDSPAHTTARVLHKTRLWVNHAVRKFPGHPDDRTANRMFVTRWEDWFPGAGHVGSEFLNLTAERPIGHPDNPWQGANLMDSTALPYRSTSVPDLVRSLSGMRQTPWWFRGAERPELWRVSLGRAGFTEIPQVQGVTRAGTPRRPLGSGAGGAAHTTLYPRLEY